MPSSQPIPTFPTTAPRRERRKQERPGELLDAALGLFVEKGFAGTRMEEVAVRAGVSKGTVFLYFPSKLDLFKAVVRHNISGRFEEWNEEFEGFTGSSADLLRHAMLGWWERIGATKASGISKLMTSEGSNFPEIAEFFNHEVVQPGQAMLGRVIKRGIESGEFRHVRIEHAVQGMVSVLFFLALVRNSTSLTCAGHGHTLDPTAYLREQANIMACGLAATPLVSQGPE